MAQERKQHHARARESVTVARVGGWAQRLAPWEISLCEAVLGERLRARGYRRAGAPAPPAGTRLRYERVAFRHRSTVPKQLALRAYRRLARPVADLG